MPKKHTASRPSNQQVSRAGEHFVVAELNKRGAFAVPFAGNMPKIDLIAFNKGQSHIIQIQVKTKSRGRTWQSSIRHGQRIADPPADETNFWIFVDLGDLDASPRYWLVPDSWMRDDIYRSHEAWLERHGGKRPRNPDATHHSIHESRLTEWQERWDVLGIFD